MQEYKGIWISYLEYQSMDFSNEDIFIKEFKKMVQNCKELGINTLIIQVRPFADAIYKSEIFPYSHTLKGTQGSIPMFDPLAIMLDVAHASNLKVEAWINPYRITQKVGDFTLAGNNPAARFMQDKAKQGWVLQANGGLYFNPAVIEVQKLIVDGLEELIANYMIDGIQFDDYFYPTTAPEFDIAFWQKEIHQQELALWRRQNVDSLVRKCYSAIKKANANIKFGISPQGNMQINYTEQYCDIAKWMNNTGYIDYVMPQIYWGFASPAKQVGGFQHTAQQWAELPILENIALYCGLASYKIGNVPEFEEWQSGDIMARMINCLHGIKKYSGYAYFRYDSLFKNKSPLIQMEKQAILSTKG